MSRFMNLRYFMPIHVSLSQFISDWFSERLMSTSGLNHVFSRISMILTDFLRSSGMLCRFRWFPAMFIDALRFSQLSVNVQRFSLICAELIRIDLHCCSLLFVDVVDAHQFSLDFDYLSMTLTDSNGFPFALIACQ